MVFQGARTYAGIVNLKRGGDKMAIKEKACNQL